MLRLHLEETIKCPSCGQYLKKARFKCPYCGFIIVERGNGTEDIGFFSSGGRASNMNESKEEQHNLPQRAVISDEPVFSSSGRTAANSGYTQQRAQRDSEIKYTGSLDHDPNDKEYFSSSRKRYNDQELAHVEKNPDNSVYYSSERNKENKLDKKTNIKLDHDPEKNPYDGRSVLNTPNPITEHSFEYSPEDKVEFAKHRFAAETATKIEYILSSMILLGIACLVLDYLYDPTAASRFVTITFLADLCLLAETLQRSYRRAVTVSISVVTIFFSLRMLFFLDLIDKYARAPELLLFYLPILGVGFMCLRLTKNMSYYENLWDNYCKSPEELVDVEFDTMYELYKSGAKKEDGEETEDGEGSKTEPRPDNENTKQEN